MDKDLRSVQQARELVHAARQAQHPYKTFSQEQVDRIVAAMAEAGEREAQRLGQMAHDETGFGRPESKTQKNLFATRTLLARMRGMKTCGIINRPEDGTIWEVAVPMGVVAALIPSTNPTSTAMYKAIIAAKARCGIVMSPHPRAAQCTAEALRVVAEAAYKAGAPRDLFGCMTEVSLPGTDALLEHPETDVILATGGGPMVKAAYSKGKPAYGVGSGNVPVYVDRSADLEKAAADLLYGTAFDWGTLCSTERSVVADVPIRTKLVEALKRQGGYFLSDAEKDKVRAVVLHKGRMNVEQVGKSPAHIARMAGFSVPEGTRALIGEVDTVGKAEPLSMETLSPILSFFVADGWQAGCERCIEILNFGGIGHTLGLHAGSERVIEAFALEKPAMRIVVNTVAALGSVGFTTRLFPAMTLGPGTIGGSITSDNISPMHLINIKRCAFETDPVNPPGTGAASSLARRPASARTSSARTSSASTSSSSSSARASNGAARTSPSTSAGGSWIEAIEERLRARAGNPGTPHAPASPSAAVSSAAASSAAASSSPMKPATDAVPVDPGLPMPEAQIERLIAKFKKS